MQPVLVLAWAVILPCVFSSRIRGPLSFLNLDLHKETSSVDDSFCFENGVSYVGPDQAQGWFSKKREDKVSASSADECQDFCAKETSCAVFSYFSEKNECHFISDRENKHPAEGYISGPRKCYKTRTEFWNADGSPNPESAKKISCPVLAGLWKKGKLKASPEGMVTRSQLQEGFTHIGIASHMWELIKYQLGLQIGVNNDLNIFDLVGDWRVEHRVATGIRNPSETEQDHERKFGAFMSKFGHDKYVNTKSFKDAYVYYKNMSTAMHGNSVRTPLLNFNKAGYDVYGAAWGNLLLAFGSDDNGDLRLSEEAFRGILFDADWPKGWTPRDQSLLSVAWKRYKIMGLGLDR